MTGVDTYNRWQFTDEEMDAAIDEFVEDSRSLRYHSMATPEAHKAVLRKMLYSRFASPKEDIGDV